MDSTILGEPLNYREADFQKPLDNSAPVENILNLMQAKYLKFYGFYAKNVRQFFPKDMYYHMQIPGYPLNTFNEEWDGEINNEYFEEFTYRSKSPIFINPLKNIEKSDPVSHGLLIKKEWIDKTFQFKTNLMKKCGNNNNENELYEELNDEVVKCPQGLVELTAHLDADPDPYIDSLGYNWYYAGHGNMTPVCINWIDYLLHSEFSSIYLTRLDIDQMTIANEHAASLDLGEGKNILETIFSVEKIIVVRTKHNIIILRVITKDDDIIFEKIKETQHEVPYTGISLDAHHKNILYVTTLDNKLFIVNLDRLKARTVETKATPLVDNWNTVIGSESSYYTHLSRKAITIYDKRTNTAEYTMDKITDMTDFRQCNNIMSGIQVQGTNSLYIGTDHHLMLFDLRNANNNCKLLRRWTHCMNNGPSYLSVCNFEFNKQLICMSGQWAPDMCVVQDYIEGATVNGVTMPYRPPDILSVLTEARQKGLCSDIYKHPEKRLSTAITGSCIIEHGEKYVVLMQNSLGDISRHTLYPNHLEMFMVDDSVEKLDEWYTRYREENKDFVISDICDVRKVLKRLREVPENFDLNIRSKVKRKTKFNEEEMLRSFNDEVIDSSLLDIWISNPNETNIENNNTVNETTLLNLHYSDDES